jgi:hypothetical protein
MRWHKHQQVIRDLLPFQRRDELALGIHRFRVEEDGVLHVALFQQWRCDLSHRLDGKDARKRIEVVDLGPLS